MSIEISFVIETWNKHCYELRMTSFRTEDTPSYRFFMNFNGDKTSLSSVSKVLKDVNVPMWHVVLSQMPQTSKKDLPKTLYNGTYKICQFWRYIKHTKAFNNVVHLIFDKESGSNMSFTCPLVSGTYVMQNIRVPPDTAILKLMYWPNTMYSLIGTVYSQGQNKTMEKLCRYEINATVKKLC
ncbi:uncharacterized protein LOC119666643 [Teleopsis dalmanni]|uniref:uncharacterized protein LOC119666643 n=1 Tax=Teleopsis dalmanni TaxID=139649 RepID=UPI0018CD80BC|nr:uncharacterized protein LOC119666643 [Teleopsis dalmanni]